jgi:hypothetical protein
VGLFYGEQACGWKQGAAGGGNAEALKEGAATDDVVEFFVEFLWGCEGSFFGRPSSRGDCSIS